MVDVGCSPIGALVELAEIAGPNGTVVGVDSSAEAVETARAIVTRQNLGSVRVIHADIHTLDPAALTTDGVFDAAHFRLVLVHQPDPVLTLRCVAALVRPGGSVLVSDIVNDPHYPWFDPPLAAHETAFGWIFETVRRRGGAVDAGRRLPQLCEEAGLRVVNARGSFGPHANVKEQLQSTRTALRSIRRAIDDLAVATPAEIDAVNEALIAAQDQVFRTSLSSLVMHVVAQVL